MPSSSTVPSIAVPDLSACGVSFFALLLRIDGRSSTAIRNKSDSVLVPISRIVPICIGVLDATVKRKAASFDEDLIFSDLARKLVQSDVTDSRRSPLKVISTASPGAAAAGRARVIRGASAAPAAKAVVTQAASAKKDWVARTWLNQAMTPVTGLPVAIRTGRFPTARTSV